MHWWDAAQGGRWPKTRGVGKVRVARASVCATASLVIFSNKHQLVHVLLCGQQKAVAHGA